MNPISGGVHPITVNSNGHEFAGVRHTEPGLKISNLADAVELY